MAVRVRLNTNGDEVKRDLKRIRRKGVFAGEQQIMSEGAKLLVLALRKQWRSDMDSKKKSFPGTVLRRYKAYVNFRTGGLVRPARVVNTAGDRLLRLQIKGGTKKPRGKALLIPPGKRPRKDPKRHSAGKYLWAQRKRTKDKYVGVLQTTARIPRRWNVAAAVRRVDRLMPRVARRIFRKELAAAQARR